MARRIALATDLTAISNVVLANYPALAAMVASGGFLPVEHVRRKLNDSNVVMAYDTVGGVVGLRYLPEDDVVILEIAGHAALSAASRLALWRLARNTWKTKGLTDATRLGIHCKAGDAVDTFLSGRFPQFRSLVVCVPAEAVQGVLYSATLGAI